MTTEFTGSHEMDACVWAEEFCKRNPDADEDLMRGWFANAIMAGYDVASYKKDDEIRRLEAEKAEMLEVLERIRDESGPFNLGEMRKFVEAAIRKARGERHARLPEVTE